MENDKKAEIEATLAEGIPIMENVPLARALYAKVKVEEYIPVELNVRGGVGKWEEAGLRAD